MYYKRTGSYDEIPEGMKYYINNYGCHFNKKLCDEAVSRMYTKVNGRKEKINPYTKEQVDNMLASYGVEVQRAKLFDTVYVANMCKADFLGKSVPNEQYLAMYIRDLLDDPDTEEGFVFNAFYAKCVFCNEPIDWEEMV